METGRLKRSSCSGKQPDIKSEVFFGCKLKGKEGTDDEPIEVHFYSPDFGNGYFLRRPGCNYNCELGVLDLF